MPDIESFYLEYRKDFITYAKRYRLDEEDIKDVYQDSVIAFYENLTSGKLIDMTCSVKTYLFSIGKHKLINKIKSQKNNITIENVSSELASDFQSHKIELSDTQQTILEAMEKMNSSCQELIHLFYYKKYSIEAIQNAMGYKNSNTVKAHKSRCLKKLKQFFDTNPLDS